MTTDIVAADEAGFRRAVSALRSGDLAILPTDTVYGIAADIRHDVAVEAISAAKGRSGMPLQLLCPGDIATIERFAVLDERAARFLEAIGPGGWTVILPARPGWTSPALAGGNTVAVRIPDHPTVATVVAALGAPVAASSANRHGDPSPATCADAVASVGSTVAVALDAGPAAGIDSTIFDLTGDDPRILRPGAVPAATIARALGIATIAGPPRAEEPAP